MTYAHFAGTDASRAFIGNFEEPLDRIDDLSEADLEGITEWMNFYDHHKQYRYRGWLEDGLHWGFWNRIAKVECITREMQADKLFQNAVNSLQVSPATPSRGRQTWYLVVQQLQSCLLETETECVRGERPRHGICNLRKSR
mmetsp:Transcript_17205/g.69688  ORF Transcript_17205/g.69688 Transcript_17205/m.69688 type:complete len:141 (-) Transcript_17205:3465-3887(-)